MGEDRKSKEADLRRHFVASIDKAKHEPAPGTGVPTAHTAMSYSPERVAATPTTRAVMSYSPALVAAVSRRSAGPGGSAAERLMLATEQINPLIERAEEAIEHLGFNVTACVLLDEDETSDWSSYLQFGKERGRWCLTVNSGRDSEDLSWKTVPLHTTSRETRLAALALLPALVDALSGRAEEEANAATKVVADAEDFIASLERSHQ